MPAIQMKLQKVHHGINVQRFELKFSVFHEEPSFLFLCFLTDIGIGNLILIRTDNLVTTFDKSQFFYPRTSCSLSL